MAPELVHSFASSQVVRTIFCSHEAGFLQPLAWPHCARLQFDWQQNFGKKASSFASQRCGPVVWCSSASATGTFKGLQRCWASKVSPFQPPLYALAALAMTLSQAIFLSRKVLWRKFRQDATNDVNDVLTGADDYDSSSLKSCTASLFARARECLDGLQGPHAAEGGLRGSLMQQGGLSMALLSTTTMAKDHISPVLATLCANPTFMSGLVAWVIAQGLKVFTTFFVERRWDFKMLLGSGGMPSSHSALCVALTTSVALCHGLSDALFPVCLGFSLIVMYDATGVRRHAGMQAEVLNLIVEDLFKGHPISEKKLKELLGHTPLQVGAGAVLGMLVGYLCSQGYPIIPGHGI